jgi:hypothetical protein
MTALKKTQGQLEYFSLAADERELLATFGRWTRRVELLFVSFSCHFSFDDNPGPTLRAGYARAHNAVRHLTSV